MNTRSKKEPKNPAFMSAAEINRELDKLEVLDRKVGDEMIAAGRGYETYSDTYKKTDPLSLRYIDITSRRRDLRWEVERRYGPGAPSRLPRGFGPIKRY